MGLNKGPEEGVAPVWSVARLLQAVGATLQARFPVCVIGAELGGLTRAASGHWYFTLKDEREAASLRCVMFRRAAAQVGFDVREGLRVEVVGRLGLYEARGDLQFIVEGMRLAGAGALYEEFLRLRTRLEAEGLFEPTRKRPLPSLPTRIGVITSTSGAVLHDICTTLARRAPHVHIVVYPAPVQGVAAPPALVEALARAADRKEVDLIILARGGGSLEDLWAFNDERLVRAVAASALPVISGVGHETDVTLCDLAADLRAPTPTAAAELAVPARQDLFDGLQNRADALQRQFGQRLDREAQRLDRAGLRLVGPAQILRRQDERLQAQAQRLARAVHQRHESLGQALERQQLQWGRAMRVSLDRLGQGLLMRGAQWSAFDPARVLERGYAWVEDEAGHTVSGAAAVHDGQRLRVTLRDGRIGVVVDGAPDIPSRPSGLAGAV